MDCTRVNFKANSHIPHRSPAALIHTCPTVPLPFSDSTVSLVRVRVADGNNRTASEIGKLLVTNFVELRVVAGRSRKWAGRPHAISGRPILIHTYHAVPTPRYAVALRGRFQKGMVVAWLGNGTCVNQTRPCCGKQLERHNLSGVPSGGGGFKPPPPPDIPKF
jgi:hypothetical protein